jgi:hypothetical protein
MHFQTIYRGYLIMMNLFVLWYCLMCLFEFTIDFLLFASTISIKIVILLKFATICYYGCMDKCDKLAIIRNLHSFFIYGCFYMWCVFGMLAGQPIILNYICQCAMIYTYYDFTWTLPIYNLNALTFIGLMVNILLVFIWQLKWMWIIYFYLHLDW